MQKGTKKERSTKDKLEAARKRQKKNDEKLKKLLDPDYEEEKPKKSIGFIIKCVLIVIILICIALVFSGLFNIKNIEVVGNNRMSTESIINMSNIKIDDNLFFINKIRAKRNFKSNTYYDSAVIKRKFPNTVEITIKENVPKYMVQIGDSFAYISSQGYILEVAIEPLQIPILLGFKTDLSNASGGMRLDVEDLVKMDAANEIINVAESNEVIDMITKIDISDSDNYILYLDGEGKVVYLGNDSNLNTKIGTMKVIVENQKGKNGEVFVNMDLNRENARFKESVAV